MSVLPCGHAGVTIKYVDYIQSLLKFIYCLVSVVLKMSHEYEITFHSLHIWVLSWSDRTGEKG